jgi:type IV pilus assembly protein PilF
MIGLRQIPAATMLLGTLWLSGCATQANLSGDNGNEAAEAYTRLGTAYLERDNLQRAMNALDRALEIAPDDAEALQAMAMVHQRQGEAELADETFRRAVEADPALTRARNNYAAFLYDRGRLDEACEQLEQASRDTQYDNRAQLFTNLGQCRLEMGDVDAARDSLTRAQAIAPRRSRSYLLLASRPTCAWPAPVPRPCAWPATLPGLAATRPPPASMPTSWSDPVPGPDHRFLTKDAQP